MEETRRRGIADRVAQLLSIAGHPFVLTPLVILIVALQRLEARKAVAVTALIAVTAIIPMIALILRETRRGNWTNFDVSVRTDRPRLYGTAVVLTLVVCLILSFNREANFMLRGALATLALLVLGYLVNRRLKLSLHAAFAALTSWFLWALDMRIGLVFFVVALCIGWSRVRLGRHSVVEVAAGTMLGFAVGATFVYLA